MKTKISIGLADDHDLFRNGLISLLREFPEINVVISAANGEQLMNQLKKAKPQIIFLDISMPVMNGIQTIEQIKKNYRDIKVIMLTQHDDEQTIYQLIQKGACGFLPKNSEIDTIVDAIYIIMKKGYYYTEDVIAAIAKGTEKKQKPRATFNAPLSSRELEVIKLICKQCSVKEIAEEMCLSSRTVDTYIERIYEKTGAKRREGIVFYALEHNLL